MSIADEISALKRSKNAVVLAHFYSPAEVQDVADGVGDSLALARLAQKTEADIIVLCGVFFMGETAKLLNPSRKVLMPDLQAGCSLADSITPDQMAYLSNDPNVCVVAYVNTTAAVKAKSDICITSTNALKIVQSLGTDKEIAIVPDQNLGEYIKERCPDNGFMISTWQGGCHVHQRFNLACGLRMQEEHPGSEIICHPECPKHVVIASDFVGSTDALLKHVVASPKSTFIVATESGILHKMQQQCPDKTFIPMPPDECECGCNECSFMKLNTLEKLRDCLRDETNEVTIDPNIMEDARKPIDAMLQLSDKLGL